MTFDALGAKSLGIQLTDPWGVAYDYEHRTSSLNNGQARPNRDGTFTFVISARDPGVYNWLDPEGQPAGLFAARWQSLPAGASPDRAVRSVAVVKLKNLVSALPKETVWVTTKRRDAQRAARLSDFRRRIGH